jgi:hypothetical protein
MTTLVFARGRIAWILGMVLGVILGVVGALMGPNTFLLIVGAGFFLFGLVMLIISYATGGRSD